MISQFPLAQSVIDQSQELLSVVVNDIQTKGFSFLYSFAVIVNNLFINVIFGIVGGLIGAQVINSRVKREMS